MTDNTKLFRRELLKLLHPDFAPANMDAKTYMTALFQKFEPGLKEAVTTAAKTEETPDEYRSRRAEEDRQDPNVVRRAQENAAKRRASAAKGQATKAANKAAGEAAVRTHPAPSREPGVIRTHAVDPDERPGPRYRFK